MKRLLYVVPVIAFGVLAWLLFDSLYAPPHDQLPSALLNKPVPSFSLPALAGTATGFTRADLASGHVTVLNVWASWCVPCRLEAPVLNRIKQLGGVALYGLVYKDKPEQARQFLRENGNPFSRIDLDFRGRAAIDWGVYDVPETFVIDGKGLVRLRYSGPITEDVLTDMLLPAIEAAGAKAGPASG
ncbi:MAG TPA: DsbE family thiol:disulfide interchange protein [Rhizomicrobium sp.]|jgi:cytochrome c biogenesis protein CcmG/thiol:disulfide interchange protein DsbE|nr:DsbE family thiol:disulfide interchange protein [Rhizomicrobium sp.]